MATASSAGRSGAMPLAAMSLIGPAAASSFCTDGGSVSAGRGAGLDPVALMQNLQPPQREQVVALLDRARFSGDEPPETARGHHARGETDLAPDSAHERVHEAGVPEHQPGLDAGDGVAADDVLRAHDLH